MATWPKPRDDTDVHWTSLFLYQKRGRCFPWQGTRISLLPQARNLCLGCSGVVPLLLAQSQEVKPASCFPRVGKVRLHADSPPSRPLTPMTFPQPSHLPSSLCPNPRLGEASLILQILTPTLPHRKCRLPASSAQSQAHKTARLWVLPACLLGGCCP